MPQITIGDLITDKDVAEINRRFKEPKNRLPYNKVALGYFEQQPDLLAKMEARQVLPAYFAYVMEYRILSAKP